MEETCEAPQQNDKIHGLLTLKRVNARLFVTVALWWATIAQGDNISICVETAGKPYKPAANYCTKTRPLSAEREQSYLPIETFEVRCGDRLSVKVLRNKDDHWWEKSVLAQALYRIEEQSGLLQLQEEILPENTSLPLSFFLEEHSLMHPVEGTLFIELPKGDDWSVSLYLWWETICPRDTIWMEAPLPRQRNPYGSGNWRKIEKTGPRRQENQTELYVADVRVESGYPLDIAYRDSSGVLLGWASFAVERDGPLLTLREVFPVGLADPASIPRLPLLVKRREDA